MADIKQDRYGLKYSPNFSIQGIEEADVSLELSPAAPPSSTVYGTVTDGADPIPNATVKLFDSLGAPFKHALTDGEGKYSMSGVPAGSYTVAAAAEGFRLSTAVGLTLADNDAVQADLVSTRDLTLSLGAVAGVLRVVGTGAPLGGAKITLTKGLKTVVAATYTADDGEFVFYDVADGVYTLMAYADGYLPSAPMAATVLAGSIANVVMTVAADVRTYNGTVSGMIRDDKGLAVAGCFVGLYRVTTVGEEKVETLAATTKTNDQGMYLFGGVPAGDYLVKAKMER